MNMHGKGDFDLNRYLKERCFRTGLFRLSSGGYNENYLDLWIAYSDPLFWDCVSFMEPMKLFSHVTHVGGPAFAGWPLAQDLMKHWDGLQAFFVRRELKGHGANRIIEGAEPGPGDRVLITEDVISTGFNCINAIKAVQENGAKVDGVLAIVDREEGGRLAIENRGIPVYSLTTLSQIMDS